jgi:pentatricopeptide repeat protein
MTYLQQEDFNMVLELLKKAEILTERDPAGRAATYNNLACYYRRQGKLHSALQYLQKVCRKRKISSSSMSLYCEVFSNYALLVLIALNIVGTKNRIPIAKCSKSCGYSY